MSGEPNKEVLVYGLSYAGVRAAIALFKLAVISPNQKTIGLFRGMVRTLFGWGFLVSLFTEKHQSLGDLIAGCYVIQLD